MKIYVKTAYGRTYTIECEPSDTIENIKCKIQEKEGSSPHRHILYFVEKKLKLLEDNKTLNDYNIQEESTLLLFFKLGGDQFKVIFRGAGRLFAFCVS